MYVNNADGLVSQIVHHLVNSHLVSEVFAVATYRQLSEKHPIQILLQPHFQGLIGINTVGFHLLTSPDGLITKVAGFGHTGMLQLIRLAYDEWNYDKMDFLADLKARTTFETMFVDVNMTINLCSCFGFTSDDVPWTGLESGMQFKSSKVLLVSNWMLILTRKKNQTMCATFRKNCFQRVKLRSKNIRETQNEVSKLDESQVHRLVAEHERKI